MTPSLHEGRERTLTQIWVTRRRAIAAIIIIGIAIAVILLARGRDRVPPAPGPAERPPAEAVPQSQ